MVSITIVPPGSVAPFHDPKTDAAHDAANQSLLSPPALNVEQWV
eukprot:SAG31_NODE_7936_length_1560_cov_2.484600_1_plen_43_part_10